MCKLNFLNYYLYEKLINVKRVSKTRKGGRIISFTALTIVGNKLGIIGIGYGKSKDIQNAIQKSYLNAKSNLFDFSFIKNTIPYIIKNKKKNIIINIIPAKPGTGIIAASVLKYFFQLIGIKNIIAKIHGSTCPHVILKNILTIFIKIKLRKHIYYEQKNKNNTN